MKNFVELVQAQGNASAQFNLGLMYANGDGVPKDAAEAVKWYRKAADQGNAHAQFILGVMYANGEGVPKDAARSGEVVPQGCRSGQRGRSISSWA